MPRFSLTAPAAEDIELIHAHLEEVAGLAVADRIASEFEDAFNRLAAFPGQGHFRVDLAGRQFRFMTVHTWLVIYRPDVKPVRVVRVLHASRDIKRILNEE